MRAWLEEQGFAALADAFEREGVTLEMVADLSDDELIALGVTRIGDRRRLRQAARAPTQLAPSLPGMATGTQPASAPAPEHVPWFPVATLRPLLWFLPTSLASGFVLGQAGAAYAETLAFLALLLFLGGCFDLRTRAMKLEDTDPSGVHRLNVSVIGPGVLALAGVVASLLAGSVVLGNVMVGIASAGFVIVWAGGLLALFAATLASLRRSGSVGLWLFGLGVLGGVVLLGLGAVAFAALKDGMAAMDLPGPLQDVVADAGASVFTGLLVSLIPLLAFFVLGLQATLTPLEQRQPKVKTTVNALLVFETIVVLASLRTLGGPGDSGLMLISFLVPGIAAFVLLVLAWREVPVELAATVIPAGSQVPAVAGAAPVAPPRERTSAEWMGWIQAVDEGVLGLGAALGIGATMLATSLRLHEPLQLGGIVAVAMLVALAVARVARLAPLPVTASTLAHFAMPVMARELWNSLVLALGIAMLIVLQHAMAQVDAGGTDAEREAARQRTIARGVYAGTFAACWLAGGLTRLGVVGVGLSVVWLFLFARMHRRADARPGLPVLAGVLLAVGCQWTFGRAGPGLLLTAASLYALAPGRWRGGSKLVLGAGAALMLLGVFAPVHDTSIRLLARAPSGEAVEDVGPGRVSLGLHKLTFEHPLLDGATEQWVFAPPWLAWTGGDDPFVEVTLPVSRGELTLTDTDPEAPILLDGARLDAGHGRWEANTESDLAAPEYRHVVPAGRHTLTVEGDAWTFQPREFEVAPGQLVREAFKVERRATPEWFVGELAAVLPSGVTLSVSQQAGDKLVLAGSAESIDALRNAVEQVRAVPGLRSASLRPVMGAAFGGTVPFALDVELSTPLTGSALSLPVKRASTGDHPITSIHASSELPSVTLRGLLRSYAATQVLDGKLETSWQPVGEFNRSSRQHSLRLEYPSAKIAAIRIANGYQGHFNGNDLFRDNERAGLIRIETSSGHQLTVPVPDRRGLSRLEIKEPSPSSWMTVTVEAVYPGARYTDLGISELRLVAAP